MAGRARRAQEKTVSFDASDAKDELYNWSSLRSQYLAEANNQIAGEYAGGCRILPRLVLGSLCGITPSSAWAPFLSPFGWGFYPWRLVRRLLGRRMATAADYGHRGRTATGWAAVTVVPAAVAHGGGGIPRRRRLPRRWLAAAGSTAAVEVTVNERPALQIGGLEGLSRPELLTSPRSITGRGSIARRSISESFKLFLAPIPYTLASIRSTSSTATNSQKPQICVFCDCALSTARPIDYRSDGGEHT